MSSIVFCLLLSCFTFHFAFVHPLQDVALYQCFPLSSVFCFFSQVDPPFLAMSSCHLLHGRPFDLFPLLGYHSVQRLVRLLSFILAICPAHLHFCVGVFYVVRKRKLVIIWCLTRLQLGRKIFSVSPFDARFPVIPGSQGNIYHRIRVPPDGILEFKARQ